MNRLTVYDIIVVNKFKYVQIGFKDLEPDKRTGKYD